MSSEAHHFPSKPTVSPSKMSGPGGVTNRPLSEISPMERRRNSPSWNQATKKPITSPGPDSSPFDDSPSDPPAKSPFPKSPTKSPRLFWQGREVPSANARYVAEHENAANVNGATSPLDRRVAAFSPSPSPSPSPNRRSSIENLKKASRVKNSTMFAREHRLEYDPASPAPVVERPLAAGRPLSLSQFGQSQSTSSLGTPNGKNGEYFNKPAGLGHRRGESQSKIPLYSPTKQSSAEGSSPSRSLVASYETNDAPAKENGSPTKSPGRFSLYRNSNQSGHFHHGSTSSLSAGEPVVDNKHTSLAVKEHGEQQYNIDENEEELSQSENQPAHSGGAQYHPALPQSSSFISNPDSSGSTEIQTSTPRTLRRHAKSVTFDKAPPQINEYEMVTPDPSSVASGSREGSYDSFDEDEDDVDDSMDASDPDVVARMLAFQQGRPYQPDAFLGVDAAAHGDPNDSFDASLEDTDKTPVVLPGEEDDAASSSSPSRPNDGEEPTLRAADLRGGSPLASANPSVRPDMRTLYAQHGRSESGASGASDGASRPLPPLPPGAHPQQQHNGALPSSSASERERRLRRESSSGLGAAAERAAHGGKRGLPQLPSPSGGAVSKDDIRRMRGSGGERGMMSLEERLRLMGIGDDHANVEEKEQGSGLGISDARANESEHNEGASADGEALPHISRESILRKVKARQFDSSELDFNEDSQATSGANGEDDDVDESFLSRDYAHLATFHPDEPIPSREGSSDTMQRQEQTPRQQASSEAEEVHIKQEPDDEEDAVDVYDIPDMYSPERSPSRMDNYGYGDEYEDREESVIRHPMPRQGAEEDPYSGAGYGDDDESHYSNDDEAAQQVEEPNSGRSTAQERPETPKAADKPTAISSLQDLPSFLRGEHADEPSNLRFKPQLQAPEQKDTTTPSVSPPAPDFNQTGGSQDNEPVSPPSSPGSIIHHPVHHPGQSPDPESPSVPEPLATIKASGGRLKTRPSITPADSRAMARQRRIASNSDHDGNDNGDDSAAPPIPERSPKRQSLLVPEGEDGDVHGDLHSLEAKNKGKPSRRESFRGLALDVPIDEGSEDLSFGLDKEFDRVIEAQKKGYLMRQNTKVVVASSRQFSDEKPPPTPTLEPSAAAANDDPRGGTRSAGNSPRKPPHERTKSWTTEPWNGKSRRRSVKGVGRKPPSGPAPPMPGQESAMGGLDTLPENGVPVDEEECMGGEAEDGERGRLFVKVVGVKDLDMPLPKNERTWFQLTLDNGLHCVTTSWLELGRSAPIGQEFELVVLNELEFQLTLQTKLEPPPQPAVESYPSASSPTKTPKQKSAFSRLLASPRKRKEAAKEEAAAREAEAAAAAAAAAEARRNARDNPDATAWELLHDLVASDGSFARAYVCLKSFEDRAFGRVLDIEVPCFNEWAIEDSEAVANSVRSKSKGAHSSTQVHGVGVVRRPPYRIGRMQLQLLYVPRPRGALEEELPRSMSSATRELREAEEVKGRLFEGCLSQQGGDCPYWRRRFFRLQGTKLTAYHETTRQPRATINLSKATKLIDDRRQLTQEHVSSRGGGRRKSAFAEEEEGYMFVEEGFRLRFANGETIDFYADDAASKDGWMKVLEDVVRSNQSRINAAKSAGQADSGAPQPSDAAESKTRWTDMVLAREQRLRERAEQRTKAMRDQQQRNAQAQAAAEADEAQLYARAQQRQRRVPSGSNGHHQRVPSGDSPQKRERAPSNAASRQRPISYHPGSALPHAGAGARSAPTSPVKGQHQKRGSYAGPPLNGMAPPPPSASDMMSGGAGSPRKPVPPRNNREKRGAVRSMIF